jgi:hypothetical protein
MRLLYFSSLIPIVLSASSNVPLTLDKRLVYSPKQTSPKAGDVWVVGTNVAITWWVRFTTSRLLIFLRNLCICYLQGAPSSGLQSHRVGNCAGLGRLQQRRRNGTSLVRIERSQCVHCLLRRHRLIASDRRYVLSHTGRATAPHIPQRDVRYAARSKRG